MRRLEARVTLLLASAVVAAAVATLGATQARLGTATGSISGRVESAEPSPLPLRRAILTLNDDSASVHLTTVADDAGQFHFTGLPAGRFILSATKAPFVSAEFGASGPKKPGTPIVLTAGEARGQIVVRLLRGAAITGTVFDTFGQPAPYQYMTVLRRTLTATGRVLAAVDARGPSFGSTPSYGVTTDDRGIYRFYGLAPGDYLVVVGARPTMTYGPAHQTTAEDVARATAAMRAPPQPMSAGPGSNSRTSAAAPELALTGVSEVPVFFPGTVTASEASPVHVEAGEEKSGIDIRIVLSRAGSLDAAFSDASGRTPSDGFAHIVGEELPGGQSSSAQLFPLASGGLHRAGLLPGTYRLEARGTITDPTGRRVALWGAADATISGGDSPAVSVRLEPTPSVAGRVAFDEPVDSAQAPQVAITLDPADPISGSFVAPITVNMDHDRFTFPSVPPGRYRLRAIDRAGAAATAWHLASATVGGTDALDSPVEFRAGDSVADVLVSMTRRTAELSGVLGDLSGRPTSAYTIVVFSADEKNWYWNSIRIRAVHLATDGTYLVNDLPAGDYLVAALADVDPSDWFDPDFLGRIRAAAIPVKLVNGTRVTQNLKITRGGSLVN